MSEFVIAYDVGTSGIKTCIFEISESITLITSAMEGYELTILENGGAEQAPMDWWYAMCRTTKKLLEESQISSEKIKGISFCAQMQGLVLVDQNGESVRKAMSYMDNRAIKEHREGLRNGFQLAGINILTLLQSLYYTRAVAASVKDPVWKYKWVQQNEPAIFSRIHKWLDVKEFLLHKCTGEFVMTEDSAYATLLYDSRKGKKSFSKHMCKLFGVNMDHLPRVIKSTEMAGRLTSKAAAELQLKEGTPVFGGGGDASLIGVGAGAVEEGNTHIYLGTSGWVSTVVNKQRIDTKNMIASIIGAHYKFFHYFCELETAGKCLEWVKNHLALDEIGIYLEKKDISESQEAIYTNLYDYMMHAIKDVPAGSNGVIFTPWLHGNRCPFEDIHARGLFFNISLETGKTELIHAVLEGICYHLRWLLESQNLKVNTSQSIRFVGGGALAPLTCQILSDILGREIETVDSPQNAGAVGAAVIAAVGLGIIEKVDNAKSLIKANQRYIPNKTNKTTYDKYFEVFKTLYKNNKKAFSILNNTSSLEIACDPQI